MKIAFRGLPFSPEQMNELVSLASAAGWECLPCDGLRLDPAGMQDCEALMGYFPRKLLPELPALKWVQLPCAGAEKYCGDLYANPNALLTNCSGAFGPAIAEYMLCGLLMLMRRMPAYLQNQQQQRWQNMGSSRTILGSRITVVGTGNIGTEFALRAKAMGARIRGVRRNTGEAAACFDEVFTSDRMPEAVQDVDAVVLCLPATAATRRILSAECIAAMKPDCLLVNCGRGSTVDEEALTAALREGRLGGCVLDVFDTEPLPQDSPLWHMENVIITPHVSGRDSDPVNAASIFQICRDNLRRYLAGEALHHIVDRRRGY